MVVSHFRALIVMALLLAACAAQADAATSERIVYKGTALGDCAMPIGGVGGGCVSICGDGAMRQWNIFNLSNEGCVVPDSFFAIWAKAAGKEPVAKLLQQTPVAKLPAVQAVEFVGEYPFADLKFKDSDLPVEVNLRAFAPFIPTNARDSAIPCAIFEFTVRNKTAQDAQVSLLGTLQNAAGYAGLSPVSGVCNKYYGGNVNTPISQGNTRGALLVNLGADTDVSQPGTMAIAALSRDAAVTPQWDNIATLWQEFARTGTTSVAGKTGPSRKGRTWNAAVTVPITLGPGQKKTVTYIWAWNFANRRVYWRVEDNDIVVGNMYTNWFADAGKTIEYIASNYARLAGDTEKFRSAFYKTTLPYYMLDRISAQSSTLVSTVCMWLKDGTFAAFEGAACCPMNCTHVWNYEQQMAHVFPELDRNMRATDFGVQQQDNGGIRHRTRLPLDLTRESMVFVDGHLGTILKAYREYRQSADKQWLDKFWPNTKRAMEYVLNDWDHNQDGVLLCWQWNTYDAAMIGPNTFIGTLYLCALRACEEMARVQGDAEFAGKMRSIFEMGSKRLDAACWNGEYYWQIEKKPAESEVGENKWLLEDWPGTQGDEKFDLPYGKGCHADQLLGQWWANQLDLGYLLPKERVVSALDAIMKHNWVEDFGKVKQTPRAFAGAGDPGLYNCTWPRGGQPPKEMLYSFEVWTGIEYEVAALLIREGKFDEACRIVKAASDRYNGQERHPIHRNPWAEVECGNHYARAMSAWGMLLAAQGYNYRGPDKYLGFDPVVAPENHASFFTTAEGWGLFTQKRSGRSQENVLSLEYGTLSLKTLVLHVPQSTASLQVKLDRRFGAFEQTSDGTGKVTIGFEKPVMLKAGEKLAVGLGWN